MAGTIVGVVRGGMSPEYEVSLKTGGAVLKHLPRHYKKVDVLIDKDGLWHKDGVPSSPDRIIRSVDVIFNALHGYYGEDGKIQKELDRFGIRYTGSDSVSSAVGMNKILTKRAFLKQKIKTPVYTTVRREEGLSRASRVFGAISQPWVIKPATLGSSIGVTIARSFDALQSALERAFEYSDAAIVEEYIRGREATCGVIENFRGEAYYALPPIEIIPQSRGEFFDYSAKYNGETKELCPSHFSLGEKKMLIEMAVAAHKAIGARHYSRSDFIVSPRGIFALETNTLPGLTPESLVPKACEAIGLSFSDFLDHVISLALHKR